VFFKSQSAGAVVTTADLTALSRLLIEADDSEGGYHELLLIGDGDRALFPEHSSWASASIGQWFALLPANELTATEAIPGVERSGGMLALRTPIKGVPLSLLTLTSKRAAYGQLASPVYALFLGAFPVILFVMAIGFERQRRRASQLQLDFVESDRARDELSRHNTLLSEEIALRKALEEDLRRKTKALDEKNADLRIAATVFESQEEVVVADINHNILRVNKTFAELSGYRAVELIGHPTEMFNSERNDPSVFVQMRAAIERSGRWQGEMWLQTKNGAAVERWLTISAVKDENGRQSHYIGTYYDLSERKKAEEKIRELAFYDQLTGLPNRTILVDRVNQAMKVCQDLRTHAALLFIDLDHFKRLNDTLGHHIGDLLLKQSAARLTQCVRESDTVSRFGGDEFVVLLTDLEVTATSSAAIRAEKIAEDIIATLSETQDLDGYAFRCTASVGVALFCDDKQSMEELLKRADMAMYEAKTAGRNAVRFFDPAMQTLVEARASLESELREDIARKNFLLHYQPQVDAEGRLIGAEALIRWPRGGPKAPAPLEIIAVAESSGLIIPLGEGVLESACVQLAEWARHPALETLTVAVNVSGAQLDHASFVDRVRDTISRTGANPHLLKLEVTESFEISKIEEVIAKMTALRQIGIRFSLDDFGTGYSSLSYLKRLPIDQLKIDRSFVRDVMIDPNDAAIAETIIALGETLGLAVIAEGVENDEQRAFLESHGCHCYQGYLFGRPMPPAQFELFATVFSRTAISNAAAVARVSRRHDSAKCSIADLSDGFGGRQVSSGRLADRCDDLVLEALDRVQERPPRAQRAQQSADGKNHQIA